MATNKKDNEDRKIINEPIAAKPLRPEGLFNSSITNKAPKSNSDTWHHLPSSFPPAAKLILIFIPPTDTFIP